LCATSIIFGFVAIYKSKDGFFFFSFIETKVFLFLALRDSFAAAWAATLQSLLIQRKRHHENSFKKKIKRHHENLDLK